MSQYDVVMKKSEPRIGGIRKMDVTQCVTNVTYRDIRVGSRVTGFL